MGWKLSMMEDWWGFTLNGSFSSGILQKYCYVFRARTWGESLVFSWRMNRIMKGIKFILELFLLPLGSHLFAAANFLSLGCPGDSCLLRGPHNAGPMESSIVPNFPPPWDITHPSPISSEFLFLTWKWLWGGLPWWFSQLSVCLQLRSWS